MIGSLLGSLVFLKFVSPEFGKALGRAEPICSVSTYFQMIGVGILAINVVMMHFVMKETGTWYSKLVLNTEVQSADLSLWSIAKEYRVFADSNSRYCRQAVFFLLINQGHQFFLGGFQYELIRAGFSKQRINELDNLAVLPVIGLAYIASKWNSIASIWCNIWLVLAAKLLLDIILFSAMPTSDWEVALALFSCKLLTALDLMLNSTIVANFPVSAV